MSTPILPVNIYERVVEMKVVCTAVNEEKAKESIILSFYLQSFYLFSAYRNKYISWLRTLNLLMMQKHRWLLKTQLRIGYVACADAKANVISKYFLIIYDKMSDHIHTHTTTYHIHLCCFSLNKIENWNDIKTSAHSTVYETKENPISYVFIALQLNFTLMFRCVCVCAMLKQIFAYLMMNTIHYKTSGFFEEIEIARLPCLCIYTKM